MSFQVVYSASALEDLGKLPQRNASQILRKIKRLEEGLHGDIKRLQQHDCSYRLRLGDYRILFDVESKLITVRRIKNRKEAYD